MKAKENLKNNNNLTETTATATTKDVAAEANIKMSVVENPFSITFKSDRKSTVTVDLKSVDVSAYEKIAEKNNVQSFQKNPIYFLNSLNTKLSNKNMTKCIQNIAIDMKAKNIVFTVAEFEKNARSFIDCLIATNKNIKGVFERDLAKAEGRLGNSAKSKSVAEPVFDDLFE